MLCRCDEMMFVDCNICLASMQISWKLGPQMLLCQKNAEVSRGGFIHLPVETLIYMFSYLYEVNKSN